MKRIILITCALGLMLFESNSSGQTAGAGAATGTGTGTGTAGAGAAVGVPGGSAAGSASGGTTVTTGSSSTGTRVQTQGQNGAAANQQPLLQNSQTIQTQQGQQPAFQTQRRPPYAPAGTYATNGFANAGASNQMAFTNAFFTNGFGNSNHFAFTNRRHFWATNGYGLNGSNSFLPPGASDRGFTVYDETIIRRIRRVVFNPNTQLGPVGQTVRVTSQNGTVTLNGAVATPADAQMIITRVQTIPGVVHVNSRLVVSPQAAALYSHQRQTGASTNLAPSSDRSLGDSRMYESSSNRFGVRNNRLSTQLPSVVTNRSGPSARP